MARILIVKPLFPYPPNQGTRRVSLDLLADLATCHEVVYLCQREGPEEEAFVPAIERLGARVVAPLMPNRRTRLHRLLYKAMNRTKSRLTGTPELALYYSNQVLRSGIERLGASFDPDLTILEGWETYPLRRSIRRGRAALLAHDAAFQILERSVAAAPTEKERTRRQRRHDALRAREIAAWRSFDGILTLTEADRDTIARLLAEPESATSPAQARAVVHLPVPIPDEVFTYPRPAAPAFRVGFLGTLRADFNRDALDWLLAEIWPRLSRIRPTARLTVAGPGDPGELRPRAEAAGAEWRGFVADLATFYGSIDVLVVPLRFGGGVRIRILEALSAAVPVVATPIAAAGIALRDGGEIALGDTPEALVAAVDGLLADPARAAALGARGREWAAAHHGAAVLRPLRLAAVEAILGM